jgi:hypothetical protein
MLRTLPGESTPDLTSILETHAQKDTLSEALSVRLDTAL